MWEGFDKTDTSFTQRRHHANVSKLASWALRLRKTSDLRCIPNDKDGGFSVIAGNEYEDMKHSLLSSSSYQAEHSHTYWYEREKAFTLHTS